MRKVRKTSSNKKKTISNSCFNQKKKRKKICNQTKLLLISTHKNFEIEIVAHHHVFDQSVRCISRHKSPKKKQKTYATLLYAKIDQGYIDKEYQSHQIHSRNSYLIIIKLACYFAQNSIAGTNWLPNIFLAIELYYWHIFDLTMKKTMLLDNQSN